MSSATPLSPQDVILSDQELERIHAYWRACNYLAAGMIYLRDNPLLRRPLKPAHIKERLLGHWGASPALSFTYVHLNRLINKYDLNAIFLAGPGHGAPGVLGPVYLEGTYSESIPTRVRTKRACDGSSRNSPFPAGSAVTVHRKPPAPFMKAGSWVTACPTPLARRSTTRICWST